MGANFSASDGHPTWADYFNKYGISAVFVKNSTEFNNATSIGYAGNDLMVKLDNYATTHITIADIPNAMYYHIDEPFKQNTYNEAMLNSVANQIHTSNSNAKLMIASYKWPNCPYGTWYNFETFGNKYTSVLDNASNTSLMCDMYNDLDNWGDVRDHWFKFKDYYRIENNLFNWINLQVNLSSIRYKLGHATNLGHNRIWVYALGYESHSRMQSFCYDAFLAGWLRGFAQPVVFYWKCTCGNCQKGIWSKGCNAWYIDHIYYSETYHEVYP